MIPRLLHTCTSATFGYLVYVDNANFTAASHCGELQHLISQRGEPAGASCAREGHLPHSSPSVGGGTQCDLRAVRMPGTASSRGCRRAVVISSSAVLCYILQPATVVRRAGQTSVLTRGKTWRDRHLSPDYQQPSRYLVHGSRMILNASPVPSPPRALAHSGRAACHSPPGSYSLSARSPLTACR